MKNTTEEEILDRIFGNIDGLLLEGNFEEVNKTLSHLKIEQEPTTSLITYLTATFPAKDKLAYRSKFYENVELELKSRENYDPRFVQGLN